MDCEKLARWKQKIHKSVCVSECVCMGVWVWHWGSETKWEPKETNDLKRYWIIYTILSLLTQYQYSIFKISQLLSLLEHHDTPNRTELCLTCMGLWMPALMSILFTWRKYDIFSTCLTNRFRSVTAHLAGNVEITMM